ncbi:hypothetical protein [Ilumatobacter sp.]|uniref:hypothetical protein n=1 Tax=Ilumatobacter sp. TaxID=1967498 RepID=UPI0030A69C6D
MKGSDMDFSKFETPDWLMTGGGAAMLIFGFFLDWTTVDTGFGNAGGDSPFAYFFTGGIAWLLVVAVAVLAFLRVNGTLPETQPWPLIFLGATGLATLLMVLRVILGARLDFASRGIGMYGALVWAGIAAAGAYLNFQASGGELSDLTDINKLKASFSGNSNNDGDTKPPAPPAQ